MGIIKVSNVSKSYCNGEIVVKALNRINLEIEKKELIAIVGRSGSGKSTLLNILGGLDTPTEGCVSIGGIDLFSLRDKERTLIRRKKIGYIFQSYNLVPVLNVFENIQLPQITNDGEYIQGLMKFLEIDDRKLHLPSQLSGGQQQRVAIARALANNPSIVLADEPTGNLDSKTEESVLQLFKDLIDTYHTTILIVTHNLELAQKADRIIRIEDGEIICNA